MLASLENYSIKFLGKKVRTVYLDVCIELFTKSFLLKTQLISNVQRGSGKSSDWDMSSFSGDIAVIPGEKISATEGWNSY